MTRYVPPPELPHNVNVSRVNPLKIMGELLLGLIVTLGLLYLLVSAVVWIFVESTSMTDEQKWFEKLSWDETPAESQAPESLGVLVDKLRNADPSLQIPNVPLQIMKEPMVNAFMAPGGRMLLTEGLLKEVESENELAFVIGHELGHFYHRDVIRAMGRGLLINLGLQTLSAVFQIDLPDAAHSIAQLWELKFSRDQETASDEFALTLTSRIYGHIQGAEAFFARLQAIQAKQSLGLTDSKIFSYFSTHPMSAERAAHLIDVAKSRGYSTTGILTPLPKASDPK